MYNYTVINRNVLSKGCVGSMIDKKYIQENLIPCQIESRYPMIRILICDDDQLFMSRMQNMIQDALNAVNVKAKIHSYTQLEEIGYPILSSCDIAFLDVDLNQKKYTGMDVARRLRSVRSDAIIFFVTNYIEYAPEGYEVQAFRYVLKNEVPNKLVDYLKQALAEHKKTRETIKIQVCGELIDIYLKDILYLESQQHKVIVHIQRNDRKSIKQYVFYASLSQLEQQLEAQGFLRVHKSYLVNMEHIKKYQCTQLELVNGTTLSVSEKNYAQQKNKYLLWKGF